jgi:hypothetical protein
LAVEQARRTLDVAQAFEPDSAPTHGLGAPHFPPTFDFFRVEWERAAWSNAGHPAAEAQAKRELVRWRLYLLLAQLTGDQNYFYEATLARPDLPITCVMLGAALGRAGRPAEAIAHLRQAATADPFDLQAARMLFQALGEVGDMEGQRRFARDRRLLAQAAPQVVPAEQWFMGTNHGESAHLGCHPLLQRSAVSPA